MAEIAGRQHGVVSTRQLIAAGISPSGISRRVRIGRLYRVHGGVYAVGHLALSAHGRWMAAVLAYGGGAGPGGAVLDYWGAAISHRSAAELWGLLPWREGPADVSVVGDGGRRRRRGIRVHRTLTLLPAQVTLRGGIPVTAPARTIADLRRAASGSRLQVTQRELRRAVRQADVLGLPLGDDLEGDHARSDLEGDFLELCRRHRLQAPEVNVRIGPHLVDFLWRERRLVVETDFYGYHRGRVAFQDDRGRDLDLRRRGLVVIRLSEKQVDEEPERVADVLRAALTDRARLRVDADAAESA